MLASEHYSSSVRCSKGRHLCFSCLNPNILIKQQTNRVAPWQDAHTLWRHRHMMLNWCTRLFTSANDVRVKQKELWFWLPSSSSQVAPHRWVSHAWIPTNRGTQNKSVQMEQWTKREGSEQWSQRSTEGKIIRQPLRSNSRANNGVSCLSATCLY